MDDHPEPLEHRPADVALPLGQAISTVGPTMAVFNNLVLFNQHEKQNRIEFIEPELSFGRFLQCATPRRANPAANRATNAATRGWKSFTKVYNVICTSFTLAP